MTKGLTALALAKDLPLLEEILLQNRIMEGNQKLTSDLTKSGDYSDGYHTFNELYEFRKVFNAALFNEWSSQCKYHTHKSRKHNDGELCFGGGWFIVCATLPTGQISNHYKEEDWDLFKCYEVEKALIPFDGHTPKDVITRINALYK